MGDLPPEITTLSHLTCYGHLTAAFTSPSAASVLSLARALPADLPARPAPAAPTASGVSPAVSLPPGGPFATVVDVPCLVPRGRCEVDFYEGTVVVRPASAKEPPFALGGAVNGVFSLSTRGKAGPAGATHALVVTLAAPLMMGKTPHRALGFCDTGAALAKAGPARARLLRAPDVGKLKWPLSGGGGGGSGGGGDASAEVGSELTAPDSLTLLKRLLGAVFGSVGEPDRSLFASATGEAGIRGYHKVRPPPPYPSLDFCAPAPAPPPPPPPYTMLSRPSFPAPAGQRGHAVPPAPRLFVWVPPPRLCCARGH
jgi:hypothetical protein